MPNASVTFTPLASGLAVVLPMPESVSYDGPDSVTFTWTDPYDPVTGRALWEYAGLLAPFEARRIAGGRPRKNLSGFCDAVCDPGAQLVTVLWTEVNPWNGRLQENSLTGIFSLVSKSAARRQEGLTVVAFACHRLRFYGLPEVQSAV